MKNLTIGQIISAVISLFCLYSVMDSIEFATSETRIGKVSDMISAAIIWLVMIQFMAKGFFSFIYEKIVSKFIK